MKRRRLALSFLVLCACALSLYWCNLPHEPTYHSRTLGEWLDAAAYQDAPWWPGQKATDEAVQAMGTNAVPFLLERVAHAGDKPSRLKATTYRWLWRLNLKKQARSYHDPWGQERWAAAVRAFHALQPRASDSVQALVAIYKTRTDERLVALDALGWLGAKEAVPFLLEQTTNKNTAVRSKAFWALGMIRPEPELVLPALMNGLEDPDVSVRHWAAKGLGDCGPAARQAAPALARLLDAENHFLESKPASLEHRMAQGAAEQALREITGNVKYGSGQSNKESNTTRDRDNIKPSPRPSPRVTRTNSQAINHLKISLAYKYVATHLMLAEVNHCAERLGLRTRLPIEETRIKLAYVAPPRLLHFLGCLDTDHYSFGFGESGRLRFITRLHPFGDQPLPQLQRRLARVEANMTTNTAYQLARKYLIAASLDVIALERKYVGNARQHFYYGPGGHVVPLPIFDIVWGTTESPAVIATIYGPTGELLQLRQNEESFSGRPVPYLNNIEALLAIPESEFVSYTTSQRTDLLLLSTRSMRHQPTGSACADQDE